MNVRDAELVMQVGAGCPSGSPDVADDLALLDPASLPQAGSEAVQVAISRRVPVMVPKDDEFSVAALLADKLHDAISGGAHVGSDWRGVVNPLSLIHISEPTRPY